MKNKKPLYHGYGNSPEIISHAVWLYHGFCRSLRDIEELLAERGINVTYEFIRQWCNHFGPAYTQILKKRSGRLGDQWYLDEVFIKIRGELHYLWRAVDQDGDTIDLLVQKRRNKQAAKHFFRKLLKGQCASPGRMITDKLKSYSAAHAQRLLSVHGPVQNLFRVGRHLLRAVHHRLLRTRSFPMWDEMTCAC
jgi:putative transposase